MRLLFTASSTTGRMSSSFIAPMVGDPQTAGVTDTFTRADGALNGSTSDSGHVWTAEAALLVATNQLAGNSVGVDVGSVLFGAPNHKVSLTITVMPTTNYLGVTGRGTDTSNYYIGEVGSTGDGRIRKNVGGVLTTLGTVAATTFAVNDKVSLGVVGASLTLLKNDVVILTVGDTELQNGNRVGVRYFTPGPLARGDNFTAVAA